MGDWRKTDAERRLSAKAFAQEGVISLAQAVEAGMSERGVQRSKWLHRVTSGVYAVGHTRLSQRAYLWVAHLATGGAISHVSAAWAWGLVPVLTAPIHVTTTGSGRSRRGIHVHRAKALDVEDLNGLPVTSV